MECGLDVEFQSSVLEQAQADDDLVPVVAESFAGIVFRERHGNPDRDALDDLPQVFGEKLLYPPAAPRTDAPLAPVQAGQLDEEQLRREQKLLLDYARMAVTEENVDILARQALAARPSVSASTLADEYPNDFARIIGLHTYSQSPRRCYDIQLTGEWATRGGFRFEEFTLTPRKEDAEDDRNE